MKDYNEMATDVFRRIGEYQTEQKKKRKTLTRAVTSLCCVCLIGLLSFGVWQGSRLNSPPAQTVKDAVYPGIKGTFEESKGESADNPAANNKIIVHQIDAVSDDMAMNIALMADDFTAMDKGALNEYYGMNVVPSVPEDLEEWEDQQHGIYRRNGGTGEVYWDSNGFTFSNEDFSRSVNVEIKKDSMPLCDYFFYHSTEERSIINNIEIAIGQSSNGYYYAQFMNQNVGFQIVGEGLSQEEFVAVISSLIQ